MNANAVPVPYAAPPAVAVAVELVPPLAIGRVPVTPAVNGRPVALVKTRAVGVPSAGVTRVGLLDSTTFTVPVLVVTPVPPLATANVPATVTIPVDAVDGVRPVEPKEIELTPDPLTIEPHAPLA